MERYFFTDEEKTELMKDILDFVNNDMELIEYAKNNNKIFADGLREIVGNENGLDFAGSKALALLRNTPRFHYIKNFNGTGYDVTIDTIARRVTLSKI